MLKGLEVVLSHFIPFSGDHGLDLVAAVLEGFLLHLVLSLELEAFSLGVDLLDDVCLQLQRQDLQKLEQVRWQAELLEQVLELHLVGELREGLHVALGQ